MPLLERTTGGHTGNVAVLTNCTFSKV